MSIRKSTGIVRNLDKVGRIVLQKNYENHFVLPMGKQILISGWKMMKLSLRQFQNNAKSLRPKMTYMKLTGLCFAEIVSRPFKNSICHK